MPRKPTYRIRINEQLDIDAALAGQAADAGLTYEIPETMQAYATINAATGVLTAAGIPATVLVLVRNAAGDIVDRIMVIIAKGQQYDIELGTGRASHPLT